MIMSRFNFYKEYFFEINHGLEVQFDESYSYLQKKGPLAKLSFFAEIKDPYVPGGIRTGLDENCLKKYVQTALSKDSLKYYGKGLFPYFLIFIEISALLSLLPTKLLINVLGLSLLYSSFSVLYHAVRLVLSQNKPTLHERVMASDNIVKNKLAPHYLKLIVKMIISFQPPARAALMNAALEYWTTINKAVHLLWVGHLFAFEFAKKLIENEETFKKDVKDILEKKHELSNDPQGTNIQSTIDKLLSYLTNNKAEQKNILNSLRKPAQDLSKPECSIGVL